MTKHRKALKNAALSPFPNTWPASLCSRGSCHTGLRAASRTQQPQNLCTFCSQCLEGSLSRSPHGGRIPIPPSSPSLLRCPSSERLHRPYWVSPSSMDSMSIRLFPHCPSPPRQ